MMRSIDGLDGLLKRAAARNIFGTKMRSVIKSANPDGIRRIADQQFEYGKQIAAAGLVPIIEPEVDIFSADKAESEKLLKAEIRRHLDSLPADVDVMLKLSIPSEDNFYADLIAHPRGDAHRGTFRRIQPGRSGREACAQSRAHRKFLAGSFGRFVREADGRGIQQNACRFRRQDLPRFRRLTRILSYFMGKTRAEFKSIGQFAFRRNKPTAEAFLKDIHFQRFEPLNKARHRFPAPAIRAEC